MNKRGWNQDGTRDTPPDNTKSSCRCSRSVTSPGPSSAMESARSTISSPSFRKASGSSSAVTSKSRSGW